MLLEHIKGSKRERVIEDYKTTWDNHCKTENCCSAKWDSHLQKRYNQERVSRKKFFDILYDWWCTKVSYEDLRDWWTDEEKKMKEVRPNANQAASSGPRQETQQAPIAEGHQSPSKESKQPEGKKFSLEALAKKWYWISFRKRVLSLKELLSLRKPMSQTCVIGDCCYSGAWKKGLDKKNPTNFSFFSPGGNNEIKELNFSDSYVFLDKIHIEQNRLHYNYLPSSDPRKLPNAYFWPKLVQDAKGSTAKEATHEIGASERPPQDPTRKLAKIESMAQEPKRDLKAKESPPEEEPTLNLREIESSAKEGIWDRILIYEKHKTRMHFPLGR